MSEGLADIFGLSITVSSLIIAIIAVTLAGIFGRTYKAHIDEIAQIRGEYHTVLEGVRSTGDINTGVSRLHRIALKAIFDCVMTSQQIEKFSALRHELVSSYVWAGKNVSQSQAEIYGARIEAELERLRAAQRARTLELYMLVGGKNNRSAYLVALTETDGDDLTAELLDNISTIATDGWNAPEIAISAALLKRRLAPAPARPTFDASAWTGRY